MNSRVCYYTQPTTVSIADYTYQYMILRSCFAFISAVILITDGHHFIAYKLFDLGQEKLKMDIKQL